MNVNRNSRDVLKVPNNIASIMESALREGSVRISNFGEYGQVKRLSDVVEARPLGHNDFIVNNKGVGVEKLLETKQHTFYKLDRSRRLL